MIDIDQTHVYQFGQLAIMLYKGRVLAVGLNTGVGPKDSVVLLPCDEVRGKGAKTHCKDEELHRLCVKR